MEEDLRLDPLSRLAIQHGTDKFGQHLYTPIYHKLFRHLREEPIRVLEIGIGWPQLSILGGASLRMWRDYFPFATLVGLDVQPKNLPDLGPRVTVIQGSQTDAALLRRMHDEHGPFDIVIDDGSHVVTDVLTSFETLYPLLQDGALYAIEDTQTAFWPEFGGNAAARDTIMSKMHEIVLSMHAPEARAAKQAPAHEQFGDITASVRVHRNMVVFERGANDYPSNRGMTLGHEAVLAMLRRLEAEAAHRPGVGSLVTQLGLLEVTGEQDSALDLVRGGLQLYPDSPALMSIAQYLSMQAGDLEESRTWLDALLRLSPDEPFLQKMAAKMDRQATAEPSAD